MTTTAEISNEVAEAAKAKLPNGWRWVKLGEIVRRQSSNSQLIKGRLSFSPASNLFPAYSASGQDVWHIEAEHKGKAIILSAVGARCGKCFLADGEWSAIANTHIIWPIAEQVDVDFLWYLLNDENFWAKDQAIQPFVQVGATLQKEIALPPLAEQKRIAGILKEQMAAVDRARASAEAQLQAAEHLPAAYLRAIFTNGESKSWERKTLGELCKIVQGEALGLPELTSSGFPVYGANGRIGYYTRYHYEKPQVLVSCRGAKCAAINFSEPKSYVTNNSMAMLPRDASQLDIEYLRWVLDGGVAKAAISGSAQPQITRESLSPIEIIVPPLADQKRIAAQLSSQMAAAERLRQMLTDQLDAIDKLPVALLRRAFNGEI